MNEKKVAWDQLFSYQQLIKYLLLVSNKTTKNSPHTQNRESPTLNKNPDQGASQAYSITFFLIEPFK
jgi:hypothetical protein